MPQDFSEGTPPTTLHFRFPPPAVGGAPKTGWEALEKWVGSGGNDAGVRDASAPKGTTGWEALEKWVPGGTAADKPVGGGGSDAGVRAASGAKGTTGWEALDK